MDNYPLPEEGITPEPPEPAAERQDDGKRYSKLPDQSILSWFDLFHKWDFIQAEATESKPRWKTVIKFSLTSKTLYQRWQSSTQLIGVRFKGGWGGTTSYALLDIDIGSQYHPQQDPSAIQSITAALESIGLCRHIKIRSSFSGGLHLYFPLPSRLNCYRLAVALKQTLEKHGLQIKLGQLEIFPNVKAPKTLYQAHRLPLQLGSFVLDDDFQPVHNSLEQLIQTWSAVAAQQDLARLTEIVDKAKQLRLPRSENLEEWQSRLEELLTNGFTSKGQTNELVKETCIYLRVFKELPWEDVKTEAHSVITQMPGYHQYCGHKRDLRRRIRDWVKSNRNSNKYYPASKRLRAKKIPKAPPNEVRSQEALERITQAIASLTEAGTLPIGIRARQIEICKAARCSASTLYEYKGLWHPHSQDETGVTPDVSTDSAASEDQTLSSDHAALAYSDEQSECVTVEQATDSANVEQTSNNEVIAETQSNQAVTDLPLLSVYSECGSEDPLLGNNSKDRSVLNQSSKQSSKFPIGSIVKWRKARELLRIVKIEPNGMYQAKWLNPPVPRVVAFLPEDEIELASA